MSETVTLQKEGGQFASFRVRRVPEGLEFYVKSPSVHDFMKAGHRQWVLTYHGADAATQAFSENYLPTYGNEDEDGVPFNVYNGKQLYNLPDGADQTLRRALSGRFDLTSAGTTQSTLVVRNDSYGNGGVAVNLTPLRLAKLDEGVTIVFRGIFPRSSVREFVDAFRKSLVSFYTEYLRPFDVSIELNVREITDASAR